MSKYEYKIGYGKPPKSNRFKKGESGNPKGRPKKVKRLVTMIMEELDKKSAVISGKKVTLKRALAVTLTKGAIKDQKTLGFLVKILTYPRDIGYW